MTKNNSSRLLKTVLTFNSFWILVLLSAGARFYGLGDQSYWVDEMTSIHFVSQNDFKFLFLDNHPILYHLLLTYWVKWFGTGEWETRSLSCLFSILSTPLLGILAWRIFKNKISSYAAMALHAFSAFSIIYAQETRMYSLFEFTSLLSFLIFYEIRKKDLLSQASVPKSSLSRPWLHWLWLISLVIVILSHYVGLYVAGVQILIFAYMRDWHKSKKGKAALFLILSIGLLALIKIIHSLSLKHLGWQNIKFTNEPLARFPLEISLHLTHLSYLALIWYLLLIGLCIVPLKNFKLRIQPEAQLLLGFTALTLLLGTAATWVTQRGLLIPRYYIFLNPVFIILTVSLWQSLKSWLKYALILVSLIFSLGWLPKTYFSVKAPWNRLAQTVLENQGEIVFTTRTLTIATPYFNNARIKVEKLDLTDEGLRSLVELVHQGRKIWIVENYWGQMNYFSKLTSKLTELGIKFDYQEFENDYSERLSAIRLY